jgi:ketosteroid isomerase-like protein
MARYLVPAVLTALSLSACYQAPFDAYAEAKKLSQRDAEWAKAASEGKDIEKIVSFWSDDARVIEPGQPPHVGKVAIREFVTASFMIPGFKIHWVSGPPVFSEDGSMAYMFGDVETTAPAANGVLTTTHSRAVTIWRRAGDGEWRCVVDIANEAPPPQS